MEQNFKAQIFENKNPYQKYSQHISMANVGQRSITTNPFFISTIFYIFIAILAALLAALFSLGVLTSHNSISWIRIHFITIGVMSQIIIGYLLHLSSSSQTHWVIWIPLNLGLLLFFIGRILLSDFLLIFGGIFLFISVVLFLYQILSPLIETGKSTVWLFYVPGTLFLLIGIVLGTGIWLGWSETLNIKDSLESHIHANNWGFMALVFSGLIIDNYDRFTGTQFNNQSSVKFIAAFQVIGALGLVVGPWIGFVPVLAIGLITFLVGTAILLYNVIKPVVGQKMSIGFYHLVFSYAWITIPLLVAPFVILDVDGFEFVEANAPQALIYGWVLQAGFALIPYLLRVVYNKEPIQLGGHLVSFIFVNLGCIFLWLSIFIRSAAEILHGMAYILWFLALLPILMQTYVIVKSE